MRRLWLTMALLLCTAPAWATTYYVAITRRILGEEEGRGRVADVGMNGREEI